MRGDKDVRFSTVHTETVNGAHFCARFLEAAEVLKPELKERRPKMLQQSECYNQRKMCASSSILERRWHRGSE